MFKHYKITLINCLMFFAMIPLAGMQKVTNLIAIPSLVIGYEKETEAKISGVVEMVPLSKLLLNPPEENGFISTGGLTTVSYGTTDQTKDSAGNISKEHGWVSVTTKDSDGIFVDDPSFFGQKLKTDTIPFRVTLNDGSTIYKQPQADGKTPGEYVDLENGDDSLTQQKQTRTYTIGATGITDGNETHPNISDDRYRVVFDQPAASGGIIVAGKAVGGDVSTGGRVFVTNSQTVDRAAADKSSNEIIYRQQTERKQRDQQFNTNFHDFCQQGIDQNVNTHISRSRLTTHNEKGYSLPDDHNVLSKSLTEHYAQYSVGDWLNMFKRVWNDSSAKAMDYRSFWPYPAFRRAVKDLPDYKRVVFEIPIEKGPDHKLKHVQGFEKWGAKEFLLSERRSIDNERAVFNQKLSEVMTKKLCRAQQEELTDCATTLIDLGKNEYVQDHQKEEIAQRLIFVYETQKKRQQNSEIGRIRKAPKTRESIPASLADLDTLITDRSTSQDVLQYVTTTKYEIQKKADDLAKADAIKAKREQEKKDREQRLLLQEKARQERFKQIAEKQAAEKAAKKLQQASSTELRDKRIKSAIAQSRAKRQSGLKRNRGLTQKNEKKGVQAKDKSNANASIVQQKAPTVKNTRAKVKIEAKKEKDTPDRMAAKSGHGESVLDSLFVKKLSVAKPGFVQKAASKIVSGFIDQTIPRVAEVIVNHLSGKSERDESNHSLAKWRAGLSQEGQALLGHWEPGVDMSLSTNTVQQQPLFIVPGDVTQRDGLMDVEESVQADLTIQSADKSKPHASENRKRAREENDSLEKQSGKRARTSGDGLSGGIYGGSGDLTQTIVFNNKATQEFKELYAPINASLANTMSSTVTTLNDLATICSQGGQNQQAAVFAEAAQKILNLGSKMGRGCVALAKGSAHGLDHFTDEQWRFFSRTIENPERALHEALDTLHTTGQFLNKLGLMALNNPDYLAERARAVTDMTLERFNVLPPEQRIEKATEFLVHSLLSLSTPVIPGGAVAAAAGSINTLKQLPDFVEGVRILTTVLKAETQAAIALGGSGRAIQLSSPMSTVVNGMYEVGLVGTTLGAKVATDALKVVEENPGLFKGTTLGSAVHEVAGALWSMPEKGKMINGRWFTQHALERMAPDTFQVRAVLESRALKAGKLRGSKEFLDYVQPRGIPPMVVEDAIQNGQRLVGKKIGTLEFVTADVTVMINELSGNVITVMPK